jgi:hypothetical protein
MRGWVAEWLKAHAWKACIRETVSRVRIPPHPPPSLDKHLISLIYSDLLNLQPIIQPIIPLPTGLVSRQIRCRTLDARSIRARTTGGASSHRQD